VNFHKADAHTALPVVLASLDLGKNGGDGFWDDADMLLLQNVLILPTAGRTPRPVLTPHGVRLAAQAARKTAQTASRTANQVKNLFRWSALLMQSPLHVLQANMNPSQPHLAATRLSVRKYGCIVAFEQAVHKGCNTLRVQRARLLPKVAAKHMVVRERMLSSADLQATGSAVG
jgi:hypothetical protein